MAINTIESTNTADWDLYQDGNLLIENRPWFLYLTLVRGKGLDDPQFDWNSAKPSEQRAERDVNIGCRTTDIITSTGTVLHVLHSQHYPYIFASGYDVYYVTTQEQ